MTLDESNTTAINARMLDGPTNANVNRPGYHRAALKPGIVHIGVGAFHRAHQARYIDRLLENQGTSEWAICGVGIMPNDEAISTALRQQDYLYSLIERDEEVDRCRIVGSIVDHRLGFQDPSSVFDALAAQSTRVISLTVTEGGYFIDEGAGLLQLDHPWVAHDLARPATPSTVYGFLLEGLARRKQRGHGSVTVLCCDNIQHNGDVVRQAVVRFANAAWPELLDWLQSNVTFPNCMVDRITPATGPQEREWVRERFGLNDQCPVVSETFSQWIIEDRFAAGRPPLEEVGVQFVSDVTPFEKMKLRLLNATHSAMGYLGYLLGYRYIHDVASAEEFEPFLRQLMDREMTPFVGEVPGIDLDEYKVSLLQRFRNHKIRDTVLRICSGGSAKIPGFILPAVREALDRGTPIEALTCVVASWLRFCSGRDEHNDSIPLEDPLADRLRAIAQAAGSDPAPYLEMDDLFGDLGKHPRFVSRLRFFLETLCEQGAARTLDHFSE